MNIILNTEELTIIGENEFGKPGTRNYLCARDFKIYKGKDEIGFITFEKENNKYAIVFQIYNGFENNGFATKAVNKVIKEVVNNNQNIKILAHVDNNNNGASRVLVKCHFRYNYEDNIFEYEYKK